MFVVSTDTSSAYAAAIIGAPNASAILVAVFHCSILSGDSSIYRSRYNCGTFRWLFALSCLCGVLGNVLHAKAVETGSIRMAVIGRLVFGLSSVEILQRHVLAACNPSCVVAESARFAYSRILGVAAGLWLGALAEAVSRFLNSFQIPSLQYSSWLLAALWLIHVVRVCIQFRPAESDCNNQEERARNDSVSEILPVVSSDSDDSSLDSDAQDPSSIFYNHESAPSSYGALPSPARITDHKTVSDTVLSPDSEAAPLRRKVSIDQGGKRIGLRQLRVFAIRSRKLIESHVGIPVSLLSLLFSSFVTEILITGTPIMTYGYFGWTGAQACLFLGLLSLAVVPIHVFCERVSRSYEERTVVKVRTV